MLGRTDPWPFGRARRDFAFILGGVLAALLFQGQPVWVQEAQSTPPSTGGRIGVRVDFLYALHYLGDPSLGLSGAI